MERTKFWIDNGILFCEICNPDETLSLEVATVEAYIKGISSLCKGIKMPFLIDFRDSRGDYMNSAAKLLASSSELKKLRLSEAFVVNSLNMKLLVSSYKRIYEPTTPFEIFKVFDEALAYSIKAKEKLKGSI